MLLKMFSVYDSAVEAYIRPMFLPSVGLALRGFTEAVNGNDPEMTKYPSQYVLFDVGTFDDSSCTFTTHTPVSLGVGSEFVQVNPVVSFPVPATLLEQANTY